MFEARNLDGSALEDTNQEKLTEEDVKVRDFFTQMISDFARTGKVSVDGASVPSFSSSTNNFLQVSAKPKVASNFRYCEMALWAGLAQRLQSASCQFLSVLDSGIKDAQSILFDTVSDPRKKAEESLSSVLKSPLNILPKGKGFKGGLPLIGGK